MRPARRLDPLALLAPTLLVLSVFYFYPLLLLGIYSLQDWDLLTPPRYVGLGNYQTLWESGALIESLGTTLRISVSAVLASTFAGLALALAVNRPGRLAAFVRSSIFSAYVVSWVSVGLLWLWLLDADSGVLASALRTLLDLRKGPLANPAAAPWALALVIAWKITGYAMVLFLSGLQAIPKSVLEASALDGASAWSRFRYVLLPLLAPTTAFVTTTSLILTFQAFDVVRVMTQGGPVRSTTVFVYSIYEQMFMDLRVGRASAEAMVFFLILLALTGLELWAFKRRGAL